MSLRKNSSIRCRRGKAQLSAAERVAWPWTHRESVPGQLNFPRSRRQRKASVTKRLRKRKEMLQTRTSFLMVYTTMLLPVKQISQVTKTLAKGQSSNQLPGWMCIRTMTCSRSHLACKLRTIRSKSYAVALLLRSFWASRRTWTSCRATLIK